MVLESAVEESYRSTIGTVSRLLCVPVGTALADSRKEVVVVGVGRTGSSGLWCWPMVFSSKVF